MNVKLNTVLLSSSLALSCFVTTRVMAGESNKTTEFEFSVPVEIPGHVLVPGKYVFELLDDDANRNVVQIFSEGADGSQTLIATVLAVPDYTFNIPDKPVVHFEERSPGTPVAIHSWFYPGESTGWEFVYAKGQTLETNATTPKPAPVATAAVPRVTPPRIQATAQPAAQTTARQQPTPGVRVVEERIFLAQNEAPTPPPVQGTEIQTGATQLLPQTGGNSGLEIMIGVAMLGSGRVAVFASRRKSVELN